MEAQNISHSLQDPEVEIGLQSVTEEAVAQTETEIAQFSQDSQMMGFYQEDLENGDGLIELKDPTSLESEVTSEYELTEEEKHSKKLFYAHSQIGYFQKYQKYIDQDLIAEVFHGIDNENEPHEEYAK